MFNYGISAYVTDQEYLLLKEHVIKIKPKIIILTVAPNDFKESYVKNLFYLKEKKIILDENNKAFHRSKLDQLFWTLSINSQTFNMFQLRIGKNYGTFDYVFNYVTNGVFFEQSGNYNVDSILFLKNKTLEMHKSIELFSKLIEKMNDVCVDNDIIFVIVNLPIKMQFDGTINGNEFDQNKIANILKKLTYKNNIYYLDLYPIFQNSEDPLSYYIREEYHLNEKGHNLVGEEIYKFIKKKKMM